MDIMGVWDSLCLVCGCALLSAPAVEVDEKTDEEVTYIELSGDTAWLGEHDAILYDETLVQGGKVSDGGEYETKTDSYQATPGNFSWSELEHCIVMHRNCRECLEKHLKYKMQFADNIRNVIEFNTCMKPKMYPIAKNYQEQFWPRTSKKDEFLLADPLGNSPESKKNRDRILRIWKPLVKRFKKKPPRPSPAESAGDFKKGTVRKGYDGNMWKVVKNKWVKQKD